MNKKDLSERDICTKLIIPALLIAGWTQGQIREEVRLYAGRVIVRGKLAYRISKATARGGPKRADFVIYASGNIPIAVIEVKRAMYAIGAGMQQALDYAEMLDAPIAISTNAFPVIATTSKLLSTGVDAKTCKLIVLDQTINSMTQFKQVIGRGTRIREDYNKLYFTIMDFKNATRLFQDPEFDGEPITVYEPKPNEPIVPPGDRITDAAEIQEGGMFDGQGIADEDATTQSGPDGQPENPEPPPARLRYTIEDVEVRTAIERGQYLDANGRLVTEYYRTPLKNKLRRSLRHEFASLDDFLRRWNGSERKQAIIDQLAEIGVPLAVLREAVPGGDDLDAFDLVAHIAFDQPPLSRKERADKVRKRNYFGKYGEDARAVLDALLDKYADHGITEIEDPKVLELPPFSRLGSKTQIRRRVFGGPDKFTEALTELEHQLYRDTA